MPGLGGVEFSEENALETAQAINQINPDFIRIRTLAVLRDSLLQGEVFSDKFKPLNDIGIAEELLLFIENLKGVTSTILSDHMLNLFSGG